MSIFLYKRLIFFCGMLLAFGITSIVHGQCTPILHSSGCPPVTILRSPLVPAPPARATSTNGREVSVAPYQGTVKFWNISRSTSSLQLTDERSLGSPLPCITTNVLREDVQSHLFRQSNFVSSSMSNNPWMVRDHIKTDEMSNLLAIDRSGTDRFAIDEPSTGTVKLCQLPNLVLQKFEFKSYTSIPDNIKLIRLYYPHAVVITKARYSGIVSVYYLNVQTGARLRLDENVGCDPTADVNDSLVVWTRFVNNRYLLFFWKISSWQGQPNFRPVIRKVFPNACTVYDFRHPRLTRNFLIFLLHWLNAPKSEIEAYSLPNLLTRNTGEACILSGDLVQWTPETAWHEAWEDRNGFTTVSFYEKQSPTSEPSVRATSWR